MNIKFPITYIDDVIQLAELRSRLENLEAFALDLEADVNLHHYGKKLCLAQIWDGSRCWLIDLKIVPLSTLKAILENREIVKVMYAASFDVSLLADLLEINLQGLFDLQICSSLLGMGKRSLKFFIKKIFELDLEKDLQTSDWYKRPLSAEQLTYAALDVRYLLEARDIFLPQLEAKELLEEAYDGFLKVEKSRFQPVKEPYLRVRSASRLTDYEKITLKEIFPVREKIAEKWDLPAYKIFRSHVLINMAQNPPTSIDDLRKYDDFNGKLLQYAEEFVSAAKKAQEIILERNSRVLAQIIELRHLIHKHPELASKENATEKRIFRFIRNFAPHKYLRNMGRNSSAYVYTAKEPGPVIVFRTAIDAETGRETGNLEWASRENRVAHLAGCDGNIAVLLALASHLFEKKLKKGQVVLLFQASASNAKGAIKVLKDKRFIALNPDYIFSLQFLSHHEEDSIFIPQHIAHPAKAEIIINFALQNSIDSNTLKPNLLFMIFQNSINALSRLKDNLKITFLQMGKTSPENFPYKAEIRISITAENDDKMNDLLLNIDSSLKENTLDHPVNYRIFRKTYLPALFINMEAANLLAAALQKHKPHKDDIVIPRKDDFGVYGKSAKIAVMAYSASTDNDSHSDFPDRLITGTCDKLLTILKFLDMI